MTDNTNSMIQLTGRSKTLYVLKWRGKGSPPMASPYSHAPKQPMKMLKPLAKDHELYDSDDEIIHKGLKEGERSSQDDRRPIKSQNQNHGRQRVNSRGMIERATLSGLMKRDKDRQKMSSGLQLLDQENHIVKDNEFYKTIITVGNVDGGLDNNLKTKKNETFTINPYQVKTLKH